MITQPYINFIQPDAGGNVKPVSKGKVYIGNEGLDQKLGGNPIYYRDNQGVEKEISNPIYLNMTGVAVAGPNDSTIINPYTKKPISILIEDKDGNEVYSKLIGVNQYVSVKNLSYYTDLVFDSIESMKSHSEHDIGNVYRVHSNGEITDYEVSNSGQIDLGNGLFAKILEPSSETKASKFTKDNRSLIMSSPVKNTAIKSILATVPRGSQNESKLMADHGYTLIFHQGIAHDEKTGEYFVTYFGQGGSDSLKTTWIDVYDSEWNYSGKTFGIRCAFAEGLIIGYPGGYRKLGHYKYSLTDGLNVTTVPPTDSIVNFGIIEPSFESSVSASSQVSSLGSNAAIHSPLGSSQGGFQYGLIRMFDVEDILTNASPTPIGTVYIDKSVIGGGSSDFTVTKPQSFCLTDYGFIFYSGYQYTSGATVKNGFHQRISQFDSVGELISSVSYDPVVIDGILSNEGYNPTIMESEGTCFDGSRFITSTVVGTDVIICSEGEIVDGKKTLNYSSAASYVASTGSQLNRVAMTRGISTIDNVALTTGDLMADYLQKASLSNLSIQLKPDATLQIGDHTFTSGLAECTNIDGNFVQIEIKSNSGNYTFTASGGSPRNFLRRAEIIGGSNVSDTKELGSLVQRMPNNFGQDRYFVKDSNNHTANVFENEVNGVIGTITMSANETSFNKTSDERLKNQHGKKAGILDIIYQMSNDGAFQNAAFKSDPDNVYPMFMAQTLAKYLPKAVTTGTGEPGKAGFFPHTVDYSSVTPFIMMALAELIEEVRSK